MSRETKMKNSIKPVKRSKRIEEQNKKKKKKNIP